MGKFLSSEIVLREVYDALEKSRYPINVVCSSQDRHTANEVAEFLVGLGIEVNAVAGTWVFAILRGKEDAKKIEEASKNNNCIQHVWMDKAMTC